MLKQLVDYMREEEFRLTLFENRVHALNYDDVLSLEDHLIRIKVKNRTIFIRGTNLAVQKLLDQEILIVGTIEGIEMK